MENNKVFEVGNLLWRTTDNALFEIIRINAFQVNGGDRSLSSYVLKCVNNMNVAERVNDHEPEIALEVGVDMVHAKNSIYTPYQPSKPKKGQHVWNKDIIGRNKEFIVEDVKDIPASCKEKPCKTCRNGICEQCHWGYRSEEDIAKEIATTYKKPETIYTMVGIDGRERYKANDSMFADSWSMLPPYYEEIDKFVKSEMKSIKDANLGADDLSETEAEDVVNDQIEKEAVDTSITIENSYETWKKSLKIVNIPKFDLKYFIRKKAYYIKRHGGIQLEADALLMSASEDELEFLRIEGGKIVDFQASELVKIPIKEYLNGNWHIVRLVEEV